MHENKQVCLNIFSVFSGVSIFLKSVSIRVMRPLFPLILDISCLVLLK